MSRKSTSRDIEEFFETVGNALIIAGKWIYENIVIVLALMVLANLIIFIPINIGMVIINAIILIFFIVRLIVERNNHSNLP